MTITPRIWEFPTFPISKQLFHVPGVAADGGFTSGGAQIITPEPGGIAVLEIEPAMLATEWNFPVASWLMSKVNGQVIRVRLAPTPQVAWSQRRSAEAVTWDEDLLWSNQEGWEGDFAASFVGAALKGTTQVVVDLTGVGPVVQIGHVIGHGNSCYLVDDIEYAEDQATITVNPSLRRNVADGDPCYLRPWFTGRIGNPADFRSTYDAENNGAIKLGKIVLNEAIVP